jgi:aspartyl-tRNA(Asn)/glutamyl-tRNA(Gln) amidotransferase subunit C
MALDKDIISQVAHLARIDLSQDELSTISPQLHDILEFIDTLKELDVSAVSPTSHILPIHDVMRQDQPKQSLSNPQALANAPQRQADFFGVPKIIE